VVPRFLIRPVVPALLSWAAVLLAFFLVADLFVMPWVAGRFRPVATVPLLRGLEPEAAADTLRARGLRFAVDTTADYSARIPKGRVLSQMPDSGAVVKQGRRVWVRLSLGREPILRPTRGP
jgi:beta-lactam-binding protein with PASTA domain